MRIAPCTVKAALRMVKLSDLQGAMFAVRIVGADGATMGVALAGFPARAWNNTGRILISRVALDEQRPPAPHVNREGERHVADGCATMLYGSICRAAKALGYVEAWTYTLPDEPGTSLRAAGFIEMGLTGGEHDRPSRRRRPAVRPEPKRRWVRYLAARAEVAA